MKNYQDRPIHDIIVRDLNKYKDKRGWLMELFRTDEITKEFIPTMSYISQTEPGISRGPHEHTDQADLFCFVGPSTFRLYIWDAREQSPSYGNRMILDAGEQIPKMVIIPAGIIHAYKNIGSEPGWVINLPNRLYAGNGRKEPIDEIRHEDIANSPFIVD